MFSLWSSRRQPLGTVLAATTPFIAGCGNDATTENKCDGDAENDE